MKKVIYIFITIVLAIFIGTTYFTGDGDSSVKTQAGKVMNKSNTEINSLIAN